MHNLLEVLPELQKDERTIVSIQGGRDLFKRLTKVLATKGATA
ncbi:hypothetical protein [Edaphobacter dinghuensis]|uniref:Uncharacterized protein n=1 Tax=Edaphobacter dinghuensis TaxID=1560005 RepID=A0A917HB24_9BACT|nr:hypothetical protein [Edaphobacter dinghuensis]GGG73155.1 hypothetical protein GCM10011585_14520 [Edaphobacter dinghuensis]